MDIFSRTNEAEGLSAYASRVMGAIGKSYSQANAETKAFLDSERGEGVWTLSVVLALWNRDVLAGTAAQKAERLVLSSGATQVLATLSLFRQQLQPFLQAAYSASDSSDLAAAAVYFRNALLAIGLNTIKTAVKASAVVMVRQKLLAEMPIPSPNSNAGAGPGSAPKPGGVTGRVISTERSSPAVGRPVAAVTGAVIKKANNAAPPTSRRDDGMKVAPPPTGEPAPTPAAPPTNTSPSSVAPPLRSSRGDRFDRADFTVASTATPTLSQHERLMAHLHIQGWSADAVEKIAKGPKG